ncbi:MAG: hypothetical protein JKY42_02500 [Flavobacteriales bacterium]|nr:hypothetical protein [Flavobacteriales bacterium]
MKRALFGLFAVLICSLTSAQYFEGKLTYKVEFDIKQMTIGEMVITREDIIEKMTKNGEYFDTVTVTLKGGNYIKEDNSSLEKRLIYKSDVNKIFVFQKDSEHEFIIDANKYDAYNSGFNGVTVEMIDSTKTIGDINCSLLKLSCGKSGESYYFYNSEIAKLDPKLFKDHNYEYFNTVVGKTNSYPLEVVEIVNNFASTKMTLVSISEEKVSDDLFNIEKIKAQKSSYFQNRKTNWSLFKDEELGYTLEYPENWIPQGGKGGFMCGEKSGFGNSEFTIWWSDLNNSERIDLLFNENGLYEGYDVIEKRINIDGIEWVYSLRTHKDKPSEYYESIVLKTKSKWYKITNSGVQNNWFEHFYNSFKLIK